MKYLKWIISSFLLAGLCWFTDWDQVRANLGNLRLELWLAALGLYLATQFVSGQRWRLLARPLGFTQSAGQFTAFVYIGLFTNLFLPTSVGGDVVKALYLDGGTRRRMASLVSVFIDRLTGLLVLLALACVAVLWCPLTLPARIHGTVWGSAGCVVLGVGLLPLVVRLSDRFERLRRLVDGAQLYLRRRRLLLAATALALVVQAANVAVVWLIGQAIGVPVPWSYYWIMVPMVSLLVMVPISVNGMGVREWITALFLAPLGVDHGTAVSLAWLWFAVFTCTGLVGGLVYLCGSFPQPGRQTDDGSVGSDPDQGRAGQHRSAA